MVLSSSWGGFESLTLCECLLNARLIVRSPSTAGLSVSERKRQLYSAAGVLGTGQVWHGSHFPGVVNCSSPILPNYKRYDFGP